MIKTSDLPDILTARDIAKYLNIGYNKALRLIRYGGMPYLKVNSTYRVSKEKFLAWINSEEVKTVRV